MADAAPTKLCTRCDGAGLLDWDTMKNAAERLRDVLPDFHEQARYRVALCAVAPYATVACPDCGAGAGRGGLTTSEVERVSELIDVLRRQEVGRRGKDIDAMRAVLAEWDSAVAGEAE